MLRYILLAVTLFVACKTSMATVNKPHGSTIKSETSVKLTESQKVERLIQFVRSMDGAVFIRNGSEHSCQQAADHLMSKWEKHKDDIRSAKEFIEKLASTSGLSGEPYKIKFKDGTIKTTSAVLSQELKRLETI